jgi:hypothetical protein
VTVILSTISISLAQCLPALTLLVALQFLITWLAVRFMPQSKRTGIETARHAGFLSV